MSVEEFLRMDQGGRSHTCPVLGCCRHAGGNRPGWGAFGSLRAHVDQHLSGNSQDGRKTRGSKSIGYLVVRCAALPLANASRGKSTANATLNTTRVPELPCPPQPSHWRPPRLNCDFLHPHPYPSCLWSSLSMASCWRPSFKLHGPMRGTPLPLEG